MQLNKGKTGVALYAYMRRNGKHFYSGNKVAIVEHCGQYLRACMVFDTGVDVKRLKVGELDYMTALDTTVEKAKRGMREAGRKNLGMSKNAKRFLRKGGRS